MTREEKLERLLELQSEEEELLRSLSEAARAREPQEESAWPPKRFYTWYHVMTGLLLGVVGTITSLAFNVIGATVTGQHPLQLIRVFLTFPMGESAFRTDSAEALILGVLLYVMTGAAYGMLFEVVMAKYFIKSSIGIRFGFATALGLGIWLVNFYGILSWLQPALYGGNWIISAIPFWVAALTHLAFAWTMLVVGEWGHFEATDYRRQAMVQAEMRETN